MCALLTSGTIPTLPSRPIRPQISGGKQTPYGVTPTSGGPRCRRGVAAQALKRVCDVGRSPYVDDMSTEAVAKHPSHVEAIASALLGPVPVVSTLYLMAGFGSLAGQTWAYALFWSLTILVAGLTLAVLAGARPLPRLADQSHLISRLSWLGRYGTAAFLLCVSTYLGGMAGTAAPSGSAQQVADSLSSLVGAVGTYALQAAIVIFLIWLAIDVKRLGAERRREGFTRAVAYLAGNLVARSCDQRAVTRWVIALTSPLLVSLAATTAIASIFLQTTWPAS